MKEGIEKMCSYCVSSIYVHTNPSELSDHNNLQYSLNNDNKPDDVITNVSIDRKFI